MSDLVEQIDALLALNAKGAVSHPVPGLAVELLERAKVELAARRAANTHADGWVMVPREPTEAMLDAFQSEWAEAEKRDRGFEWSVGYRVMLAAAPASPALPSQVVGVKELADYLWQEICELPDRTSPEEYPDMGMVTLKELTAIVETWAERSCLTSPAAEPVAWVTSDILAAMKRGERAVPGWKRSDDFCIPLYAGHPAPSASREVTEAARDMLSERQRQVDAEGWTSEHDDAHRGGSLAIAAACYAAHDKLPFETRSHGNRDTGRVPELWPRSWSYTWFKPTERRRDLVKAGALILAEIERLDRAALLAALPERDRP